MPSSRTRQTLDVPTGVRRHRALPWRAPYPACKAAADWAASLLLLVLVTPLLAVLAILVKTSSAGPVIYSQVRLGRSGREYRVYKFRTMFHNCEAATGAVWAVQDDPRSTPVGRFLRDTHLDELPQLWNVLKGEMSLIGPRPERPEIAARIAAKVPNFYQRLQMRPGVTGLAQMLIPADDPNDTEYIGVRQKLAHDLFYIRNANPILDLKIAISTFIYFTSAAMDAVRRRLLRSYSRLIDRATRVTGVSDSQAD